MRQPRLLATHRSSTYHVVSRIVDRKMVIGDVEKRFFYRWMRKLEDFCGVRVLTYCLMSNHFHLLVRVPCKADQVALTEAQLRNLLPLLYRGREMNQAAHELDRAAESLAKGNGKWMAEILRRYDARRFDLSSFVKDLKQRFSQWYNGRNQRCGHVWECAFKSVLVEDGEQALLAMAAYIDLNPVRAGICEDPKDYTWSGYGESVGSHGKNLRRARRGLSEMLQATRFGTNRQITWRNAGPSYRVLLYSLGEERAPDVRKGIPGRRGLRREKIEAELSLGGVLSLAETLRCRIRYFTEGGALGSRKFINEVFADNRERFGQGRTTGARAMAGAEWERLSVLQQPRANPGSAKKP